ncbi:hypothetical protein FD733_04270 [Pantoea sp. Eser]|nr:hypothetical protein [Pantoea sp. Eser]
MLKASYYYLCPRPMGGWILHKEGCVNLLKSDKRVFIGSLYARQQALTVAKIHHANATMCSVCLNNFICPTTSSATIKPARPATPTRHTPRH